MPERYPQRPIPRGTCHVRQLEEKIKVLQEENRKLQGAETPRPRRAASTRRHRDEGVASASGGLG
ncbi:MAG: hypothetical protein MZU91_02795 [Desulfosudis oleivorans]|nr:hypothetical protein [Desulfosudis oleivorans]